jgi:hypothetical protein
LVVLVAGVTMDAFFDQLRIAGTGFLCGACLMGLALAAIGYLQVWSQAS